MQILLNFVRVLTIVMASTGVGMVAVIAWQYRGRQDGRLLPRHVVLVGVSWSLYAANVIYQAMDNLRMGATSNLVLGGLGSVLGTTALYALLKHMQIARSIKELDAHVDNVLDARVRILIESSAHDN